MDPGGESTCQVLAWSLACVHVAVPPSVHFPDGVRYLYLELYPTPRGYPLNQLLLYIRICQHKHFQAILSDFFHI